MQLFLLSVPKCLLIFVLNIWPVFRFNMLEQTFYKIQVFFPFQKKMRS